jgi:hypothetical protein
VLTNGSAVIKKVDNGILFWQEKIHENQIDALRRSVFFVKV